MDTDLLSAAEAAKTLGRAPRTVARMAETGVLPFARKLPGRTGAYLFHRADVEHLRDHLRRSDSGADE